MRRNDTKKQQKRYLVKKRKIKYEDDVDLAKTKEIEAALALQRSKSSNFLIDNNDGSNLCSIAENSCLKGYYYDQISQRYYKRSPEVPSSTIISTSTSKDFPEQISVNTLVSCLISRQIRHLSPNNFRAFDHLRIKSTKFKLNDIPTDLIGNHQVLRANFTNFAYKTAHCVHVFSRKCDKRQTTSAMYRTSGKHTFTKFDINPSPIRADLVAAFVCDTIGESYVTLLVDNSYPQYLFKLSSLGTAMRFTPDGKVLSICSSHGLERYHFYSFKRTVVYNNRQDSISLNGTSDIPITVTHRLEDQQMYLGMRSGKILVIDDRMDMNQHNELFKMKYMVNHIASIDCSRKLVVQDTTGYISIFDTRKPNLVYRRIKRGDSSYIFRDDDQFWISPDERFLVTSNDINGKLSLPYTEHGYGLLQYWSLKEVLGSSNDKPIATKSIHECCCNYDPIVHHSMFDGNYAVRVSPNYYHTKLQSELADDYEQSMNGLCISRRDPTICSIFSSTSV